MKDTNDRAELLRLLAESFEAGHSIGHAEGRREGEADAAAALLATVERATCAAYERGLSAGHEWHRGKAEHLAHGRIFEAVTTLPPSAPDMRELLGVATKEEQP